MTLKIMIPRSGPAEEPIGKGFEDLRDIISAAGMGKEVNKQGIHPYYGKKQDPSPEIFLYLSTSSLTPWTGWPNHHWQKQKYWWIPA